MNRLRQPPPSSDASETAFAGDAIARAADPARLAALDSYAILDTPPDQGFDDVVALASLICDAPTALVSLVAGDRQWFKARVGFAPGETPLDQSVCAHALGVPDLLVIPDLARDERTLANPLAQGARAVRFYAGAPLRTPDGHTLGTLCVLDGDPRPDGLTSAQSVALAALARQVMAQLELRRAVAARDRALALQRDAQARARSDAGELRESELRHRLVVRATKDVIWDWDLIAGRVTWNDALATAYGYDLADVAPNAAWWFARIHPDDRDRVEADIRATIAGEAQDWSREYRFRRAGGGYAEVLDRGYLARGDTGAPIRMIGAMLDLTERKRADEQFRAVFEGANIGMVQLDPHTARALRVNAKICEIWGATEAEILGSSLARWTPEEDDAERVALHARLASGVALRELLEKRYRRKDGRVIWARVNLVSQPFGDGVLSTAMIEDITAEKQSKQFRDALIELADRLRDLSDADDAVAVAAEVMARALDVSRAGYGAVDPSRTFIDVTRDWTAPGFPSIAGRHAFAPFGDIMDDLARGEMVFVSDPALDRRTADHADVYRTFRIGALLNVPIMERGRLVAVFFLHDAGPRFWSPESLAFIRSVADRTRAAAARLRAEEQQRLLNHEISHRMKNLLAMVQAIASQTLRSAADTASAAEVLTNRLIALGKAQDALLRGVAGRADLAGVVREVVRVHDGAPSRMRLDGPDVEVGPQAALALALLLHELATNAVKYGALSTPEGRIAIAWSVNPSEAGPTLRLTWRERGGPPVTKPTRKGFGSRLIERGLSGPLGGVATLDYAAAGLVCTLEAPLSGLQGFD